MKNKQPKDIVEILDELACHWDGTNKSVDGVIAMEASMEIEKLRKEVEELKTKNEICSKLIEKLTLQLEREHQANKALIQMWCDEKEKLREPDNV